jgi:hypothetical protein
MAAKFIAITLAAALVLGGAAEAAALVRSDARPKVHRKLHPKLLRKHKRFSSPPYGPLPPSVATPLGTTTAAPPFKSTPQPAPESRPALITPGAPAYGPGILPPGPPGTIPTCAPLSRSQGMC